MIYLPLEKKPAKQKDEMIENKMERNTREMFLTMKRGKSGISSENNLIFLSFVGIVDVKTRNQSPVSFYFQRSLKFIKGIQAKVLY